jgi:hypothetical protein
MFMQEDKKKKEAAAANAKDTTRNVTSKSQVPGTAGGEIPDPPKMPSKTKFHSDASRDKPVKK